MRAWRVSCGAPRICPCTSHGLPSDLAVCGPAILPNLTTGQPILETLQRTTDPGRALVTGLCADLGGFKPPILRGLATRAPYFHNGAAESIEDVVNFYDVILSAHLSRAGPRRPGGVPPLAVGL